MSVVMYNNILLQYCQLVNYRKDPVYSGSQLVHVKHTITVRGVYNPGINSFNISNRSQPVPANPPVNAPLTENALRVALLAPRRLFLCAAGGTLMFVSPSPKGQRVDQAQAQAVAAVAAILAAALGLGNAAPTGAGTAAAAAQAAQAASGAGAGMRSQFERTDVYNGPIPGPHLVIENVGDKTFFVEWTVTCYWAEWGPKGSSGGLPASPLLCHEWGMEHHIDQDFFCRRVITGRAVFRSDMLTRGALKPDDLRYWLGHPVPHRFRRDGVQVRALPDGVTLEYTVVDRERTLNFDPNNVTRVEATWNEQITRMGIDQLLNQVLSANSPVARIVAGLGVGAQLLANVLGNLLNNQPAGGVAPLPNAVLAGVPVTTYNFLVRVWGHPDKDRNVLVEFARTWINQRLDFYAQLNMIPGAQLGTIVVDTTLDEAGKFVQMRGSVVGSVLTGLVGMLQRLRRPQGGLANVVPQREQRPILNDPMRGTYLGRCAAQALRDPGEDWIDPQDPDWVRDVERQRTVLQAASVNALREP